MQIQRLRGASLFMGIVGAVLAGVAFYFLIIGVFEMLAATISLGLFVALAVIVWTQRDEEPTRGGR